MKALSSTVAGNVVPAVSYSAGSYTLTGLVVGMNYYYTMGANDTSIAFASGATFAKSARATGVFTATATSATLAGSGTSAVGTTVSPVYGVNLFAAVVTPSLPSRHVTVGQFPTTNPNWSRQLQISDEYVFVKRGTYGVAISLPDVVNLALTQEVNLTWTPPIVLTQPASVSSSNATATGTLTSDNTEVADGDTVTIGATVYRFKDTMAQAYDVKRNGTTADTTLLNLIKAINASGTPGSEYYTGTLIHPTVTAATSVTSHHFAVTAKTAGLGGNAIATTETSSHLSWGGSTLSGGSAAASVSMTVTPGSEYDLSYAWQYSADGATAWTTINSGTPVNGCTYSGYTSATLAMAVTTTGQAGYHHRCTVTDNATVPGLVTTDGNAVLTVP